MKKKSTAAFLAMLLGPYGLHRFYLGQRPLGIVYMFFGCFFTMLTIEEGVPMILIPILLATIDAILFSVMPQEEFDAKYNSDKKFGFGARIQARRERQQFKQRQKNKANSRHYDYPSIIEDLQEDLEEDFNQPKTHFHLACCYSMLEKSHEAFFHLEKAITFGFVDFAAIHNHDDLAYVRSMPKFDKFVLNGYKNNSEIASPKQNLLSDAAEKEAEEDGLSLLDQIVILGELRSKGILTEEEFATQKHKLLK